MGRVQSKLYSSRVCVVCSGISKQYYVYIYIYIYIYIYSIRYIDIYIDI